MLLGLCGFLAALTCASSYLCVRSIQRNFELIERLQEINEAVKSSVEVLQTQHDAIEKKTKIELFSDDPIIKELVVDMATAKESVSAVSKLLDSVTEEEDEDTQTEEETK